MRTADRRVVKKPTRGATEACGGGRNGQTYNRILFGHLVRERKDRGGQEETRLVCD
jgi:hypothetical protein